MKVETQSSTQASSALRARSQTRPCCRASCTAGCTAGFTAAESQVSISQARYLRPCNRSIADWSHALSSEKSLTSRIQVQTSWEKLVKRRFQKPEPAKSLSQTPAKHVSTALQTFFAGWAMLGYSKISQKIAKFNVRKCRTNSSTSQARYLRPCKHLCGLGHCVVYERRLGSQPENCEMFMNVEQIPATFFTNVSG